jgi:hypothetical protein
MRLRDPSKDFLNLAVLHGADCASCQDVSQRAEKAILDAENGNVVPEDRKRVLSFVRIFKTMCSAIGYV